MSRHVRKHRVFRKAEPALFSDTWESLIPLDHPVRALKATLDSLDLRFLEELYGVQGGVAYDPRRLLGVVLYGIGDGVRSSRQLQEHCRFDNRYRFLMDGQTPDDRTFSRFLDRLNESPETLLERIVSFAKDRISLRVVSVDGTKMRASVSRYTRGDSTDVSDSESRRMKSRSDYFHGYNCQLAVDEDSGLIVGALVSQEGADWHLLEPVLDSVERTAGRAPAVLLADRGYESAQNAALCEARGIASHLAPNPQVWPKWEIDPSGQIVCSEGHPAVPKDQFVSYRGTNFQRYRVMECRRCAQKETCLTKKTPYRTLAVPAGIDPSSRIRNLHRARSEEGQALLRRRSVISETPHAQLKHNDGFGQFLRRGKAKAATDFLLWVASYNLRKLLNLFLTFWRLLQSSFGPKRQTQIHFA